MGMSDSPLLQLDAHPKTIDAKGDDGQQQPFDPVSEETDRCPVKIKPLPVDHGMFCFPAVDHRIGPGQANAKCQYSHQSTKQIISDQLQQSAVKV